MVTEGGFTVLYFYGRRGSRHNVRGAIYATYGAIFILKSMMLNGS